jgi:putative transposase
VCGVSTRRVDQLVESLGLRVSRSEVSPICAQLDEQVEAFPPAPLEPKGREDQRRRRGRGQGGGDRLRRARDGRAGDPRLHVGESETEALWTEFPRSLLAGVQLVVSDALEGLRAASRASFAASDSAAAFTSSATASATPARTKLGPLTALIRPIFQADSGEPARQRLSEAIAALEGRLSKVGQPADAEEDVLAFYAFRLPTPKLRSTNPLERSNTEIVRRTGVVGIFPDHGETCTASGGVRERAAAREDEARVSQRQSFGRQRQEREKAASADDSLRRAEGRRFSHTRGEICSPSRRRHRPASRWWRRRSRRPSRRRRAPRRA